jgi:hypothetical protein
MTLILSCLTRDVVVQVSDRRMTALDGSNQDFGDKSKVIVWHNRFLIGYTGFAELGAATGAASGAERRTDFWAAAVLQPHGFTDGLGALARATESALRVLPHPAEQRRHAFDCVGWGAWRSEPETLLPMRITLSNFHDPRGNAEGFAAPEVRLRQDGLPASSRFGLFSIGHELPPAVETDLRGAMRTLVKGGVSVQTLARPLIEAMRAVARMTNVVGPDVLVTAIPRRAVEMGVSGVVLGPPATDQVTSVYVPGVPADPSEGWVQYGPTYVQSPMIIGGIELSNRPLPPPS